MKHIIVTFFCGFLSLGNLQAVDDGYNDNFQAEPDIMLVVEDPIWPVQTYQTFRSNFYGTAQKNINAKPCVRNSKNEKDLTSYEQLIPNPTRRASMAEISKQRLTNMEANYNQQLNQPQIPEESYAFRSEPQLSKIQEETTIKILMKQDEELNTFKTQPQDLQNEGPTSLRIRTKIIKDEEMNPLRPGFMNNEESNTLLVKPKIINSEESNTLRKRKPQALIGDDHIINNIKPEGLKDDDSNTFRMETQGFQENALNNLRTGPHIPNKEGLNILKIKTQDPEYGGSSTLRKQPTTSEDEYLNTLRIQSQDITTEESSIHRSNQVEPFQSHAEYEMERHKQYQSEGITDHPISPSHTVNSETIIPRFKVKCQESDQVASNSLPERRFLINSINTEGSQPTFAILRPNSGNENNKNMFTNNQLLRTKVNDQENEVNGESLNARTNVNNLNKDGNSNSEILNANEKSSQRSGKIHFFVEPNLSPVKDPATGQGILPIKKSTLLMMDYERVCYACSSASSPACVSPDRRTGVKYCRKGDNACVTKTFGNGSTVTLIRDCGRSCVDEVPGFAPKFKTCGICYSDLCNSAYSINIHTSILTLLYSVIIVLVKPLL